jgi:hypothetical protein
MSKAMSEQDELDYVEEVVAETEVTLEPPEQEASSADSRFRNKRRHRTKTTMERPCAAVSSATGTRSEAGVANPGAELGDIENLLRIEQRCASDSVLGGSAQSRRRRTGRGTDGSRRRSYCVRREMRIGRRLQRQRTDH